MTLMQMSLSGGILVLAVTVLRALTLHRLPKETFRVLWALAAARLLLPLSLPSPLSVYTLADRLPAQEQAGTVLAPAAAAPIPAAEYAAPAGLPAAPGAAAPFHPWTAVWAVGAAVCALVFLVAYLRCRREFRTALPAEDQRAERWLEAHRLRRTLSIRQSDRISAPLTYGIFRPVILLPKTTDWSDSGRLAYVLEHELVHIQRFDAAFKLILTAAACVHWFNPLAWVMLALAGRDIELSCDEAVVRRFGFGARSDYALALLAMEEQKAGLGPFASAFSKNAIEERIFAIMKLKKTSLAAILLAAALVCGMATAFATSAAVKAPYPQVKEGTFTREELDRLASLWFEGYADMTVADYQNKLWTERDTPDDIALMDRYGQSGILGGLYHDYFQFVCEPLTAEGWQTRYFSGLVDTQMDGGRAVFLEYTYILRVLDPNKLTVGEYEQVHTAVEERLRALLGKDVQEEDYAAISQALSTDTLAVSVEGGPAVWSFEFDAELYAQVSSEVSDQWDRLLTPYTAFGLTYTFSDPDHDGNGLTMWFQGREVRSIFDQQIGWITEHTGTSAYGENAVEIYAVYTDGRLSGLRFATPEEQAEWDRSRQRTNQAVFNPDGETREFPNATRADYDALMTLRRVENETPQSSQRRPDSRDLPLDIFNQRLLDWANENPDAWNRINCDVVWNDYAPKLTTDEWVFAAVTCCLSGTENGMMIRALHTGQPEQDPGFSRNLPEKFAEENGVTTAWCNLYYDISYHIPDKSALTAAERDACVGGMMNAIEGFWWDTDLEELLDMSEADIVSRFNEWARESSTDTLQFNPVTADNIHFEALDERDIRY